MSPVTDQNCSNPVISLNCTCSVSKFGLAWRIKSLNYTELFTAADPAGKVESQGPFTAILSKAAFPATSTLYIETKSSVSDLIVECIDALLGKIETWTIIVPSKQQYY